MDDIAGIIIIILAILAALFIFLLIVFGLIIPGIEAINDFIDYCKQRDEFQNKLKNLVMEVNAKKEELNFLTFDNLGRQVLEKEARLKRLVHQQNSLITLNNNSLKILDEKERNYEKKKQKLRDEQKKFKKDKEGHDEIVRIYFEHNHRNKTIERDLKKREKEILKLEEIEKSKADEYINVKKLEADKLIHQAKKKNGVALKENQKYIATQKKQAVEEAKKKVKLFTETIEKLSINTPIKNIEQVLLEKYELVESVDIKEKESLAHICDAIKKALEKTGHEIPEFLNMVNASPITIQQNSVKISMAKFARDITEIENDDSIELSKRELVVNQYKEYWDREFQIIMES